ncbi:histidine phosphatase family protein [Olivibacter sp. SDN3]|uniref:histidine phosphatase family protein n=1 Tax=Olivibacter sp. SDN3 TaxID=2764720 RepID=UPI0016513917|nr:histidine phosphatase family protein [Olivibacter sp. SDN3]QNL50443.1 histidine phosphatase family protein [Olivibacter sp. SDN3]
MLTVYLLRHGETSYNAEGNRYCGTTDIGLTEKGLQQARLAAQSLSSISFDAAFSSPLKRAYVTAMHACNHNIAVKKDDRLMELDFGSWEGKTRETFVKDDPALWQQWEQAPEINRAGGTGNTGSEIAGRVDDFFMELLIQYPNGNILVAAHNTVNRLYLAYKLGMPLRNYRRIVQENAAITVFNLDNHGVLTLQQLNIR